MPRDDEKKVSCSFCYKTQDQVEKLIAGPNVYICNECVAICADLIEDENEGDAAAEKFSLEGGLPTPAEMKAALDQYVIGQDRAKIALCVAVYNHYKRIENKASSKDVEIQREDGSIELDEKANEVREILGAAKAQYEKFGDLLAKAKKKVDEAGKTLEDAERKNLFIQRKLKNIEAIDTVSADKLLFDETDSVDI